MKIQLSAALIAVILMGQGCNNLFKSKPRGGVNFGETTNGPQEPGSEAPQGDEAGAEDEGGSMGSFSDPGLNLVWKRYRALEQGLAQGLAVPVNELCREVGQQSCIDNVHLTVLGGNSPFAMGQYERAAAPTALTPVAVERVVLAACRQRLERDKQAGGGAVVFKFFPLTGALPGPDAVKAQAQELYKRILAREATAGELGVVSAFGSKASGPESLALSLCLAIGSHIENILL